MSAEVFHDGRPVPPLLTAREACVYLRLDEDEGREAEHAVRSLERYVSKGLIRPARVGRCNRFWRAELDRFIEQRTEARGDV